MSVRIRNYNNTGWHSDDFYKVCDFLIRINKNKIITPHFLWARWVWQFSPYINMNNLKRIGIAEDNEKIVGLATYEHDIGESYFCVDEEYDFIKPQLIDYAKENLSLDGELKIVLPNGDLSFQKAAVRKGFIPTGQNATTARIDCENNAYILPDGYTIMSFDDKNFDPNKYYDAIWQGFDNTRERNETEKEFIEAKRAFDAPHLDLSLRVLVIAPNGDYASHCGMWHLSNSDYAYVEPVFTLPGYRKMGLGKAAVLEGVRRCGNRGARCAFVLSNQQFYYNIGFYPIQNETWWFSTV